MSCSRGHGVLVVRSIRLGFIIASWVGVGVSAWSQVGRIACEPRAETELWLFGMFFSLRWSADSSPRDEDAC